MVGSTTLYDKYSLLNGGQSKRDLVALQLPYFEGDYWPQTLQKNAITAKDKAKVLNPSIIEMVSIVNHILHVHSCIGLYRLQTFH